MPFFEFHIVYFKNLIKNIRQRTLRNSIDFYLGPSLHQLYFLEDHGTTYVRTGSGRVSGFLEE